MRFITDKDLVRFIFSNHMVFNNPYKLEKILQKMNVKKDNVDLKAEIWWENNNWWDNKAFLQAAKDVGIYIPKELTIKSVSTPQAAFNLIVA